MYNKKVIKIRIDLILDNKTYKVIEAIIFMRQVRLNGILRLTIISIYTKRFLLIIKFLICIVFIVLPSQNTERIDLLQKNKKDNSENFTCFCVRKKKTVDCLFCA